MNSKLKFYMRGLGIGIAVTALILSIVNINGRKNKGMTDEEIIARAQELGYVDGNRYSLTDANPDNSSAGGASDSQNADGQDKDTQNSNTQDNSAQNTDGQDADAQGSDEQNADGQDADAQGSDEQNADGQDADAQGNDEQNADGQDADAQGNDEQKPDDINDGNGSENQKPEGQKPEEQKPEEQKPEEQKPEEQKPDIQTGDVVTITVSAGSSSEVVAAALARAGLVADSNDFNKYMVDNGYSTRIRVGTFKISAGASYEDICKILTGKQ